MTAVTGQRHEHRQPHPDERLRELDRMAALYRGGVDQAIAEGIIRRQRDPLAVPGVGSVRLIALANVWTAAPFADERHALELMPAFAGDAPPALPLALPLAPDGQDVAWIRTRRAWRAVADAWRDRTARLHSRGALAAAEIHDRIDVVAGLVPILDDTGAALSGVPAIAAREAALAQLTADFFTSDYSAIAARLGPAGYHPPEGEIADDLAAARGQCLDRIDRAADETRRWLLDDEAGTGAGPANAEQRAELERLEGRRQDGRRYVRQASTVAGARAVADFAIGLVRGAGIEGAPRWRDVGGTDLGPALTLTLSTAPGTSRWSHVLHLAQPGEAVTGRPAARLGGIALDAADAPAGWTVADAPRPTPNADERAVTLAQAADAAPGSYTIVLTARNALGPRRLTVTVVVPAAEGE